MNMISPITPESGVEPRIARYNRLPLWQRIGLVALPLAVIGGAVELFDRPAPAMAAMPTPTVTVATPLARDVDQWDEYVGRFEPSRSVEVRPRVSGAIVAIHFRDGEIARAGQPLFTIDPRPYAAALAEARAGIATARSDLVLARNDYDRALRLVAVEAEIDRIERVDRGQQG